MNTRVSKRCDEWLWLFRGFSASTEAPPISDFTPLSSCIAKDIAQLYIYQDKMFLCFSMTQELGRRRSSRKSCLLIKLFVKWVMLAGAFEGGQSNICFRLVLISWLHHSHHVKSCWTLWQKILVRHAITLLRWLGEVITTTSDSVSVCLPYSATITNPFPPTAPASMFHTCTGIKGFLHDMS